VLNNLLTWLQGEKLKRALEAVQSPGKGTSFEYGTHHGIQVALNLVEQRIEEMLEEEDDDTSE
jgi:hypothetical protein